MCYKNVKAWGKEKDAEGTAWHFERLEKIGDAVLDKVLWDVLAVRLLSAATEQPLTCELLSTAEGRQRAMTCNGSLTCVARAIGLPELIQDAAEAAKTLQPSKLANHFEVRCVCGGAPSRRGTGALSKRRCTQ